MSTVSPPISLPSIEFVNHASVLIANQQTAVLTDPWLYGDAFHHGWSLLTETPDEEIQRLLHKTTHIWISHEHPDHFSPSFFKRYLALLKDRNITVLFQKTRDGRLADFIRKQGLPIMELDNGKRYELSENYHVTTVQSDLYDSALITEVDGVRVFNINDCPIHSQSELKAFADRYGTCDLLLTQFSYAAWKGGAENNTWRKKAARHKINTMHSQIKHFQAKKCILFASFVRFSHELNQYMNADVNTPDMILAEQKKAGAELIFMAPGETQSLKALRHNPASLEFWRAQYAKLPSAPLGRFETSYPPEQLKAAFGQYQQRIFTKNSRTILALASKLLALQPFGTTRVRLIDQDLTLEINPLQTLQETDAPPDISLHSSSLHYLFSHEFGFDTLFVNACFEESRPSGFARFATSLSLGSLNASGIYIKPSAIFHTKTIKLLLAKLKSTAKKLAATPGKS